VKNYAYTPLFGDYTVQMTLCHSDLSHTVRHNRGLHKTHSINFCHVRKLQSSTAATCAQRWQTHS